MIRLFKYLLLSLFILIPLSFLLLHSWNKPSGESDLFLEGWNYYLAHCQNNHFPLLNDLERHELCVKERQQLLEQRGRAYFIDLGFSWEERLPNHDKI